MSPEPRVSVQAGLDHLADRLDPIIAARLASVLNGLPWRGPEHRDRKLGQDNGANARVGGLGTRRPHLGDSVSR